MEGEVEEKKGVALKAFGMSLVLLAGLNLMFCWRGGFAVNAFYPVIMGIGIALFILGVLRGK